MAGAVDVRQVANTLTPYLQRLSSDQHPFAMSVALNATAFGVRQDLQADMRRVFDNPVKWTLGGVRYSKATKKALTATVFIAEDGGKGIAPAKYLLAQVEGGQRRPKRMERALQSKGLLPSGWYAVPSRDLALDANGNVKGGIVTRILSDLGAFGESGYTANRVTKSKARNTGRRFKRSSGFFSVAPGGRGQPGIYQITPAGLRVVFIYVRSARYVQRFDLDALSERHALRRFPAEYEKAMNKALATARG
jgi:hypothetical protein